MPRITISSCTITQGHLIVDVATRAAERQEATQRLMSLYHGAVFIAKKGGAAFIGVAYSTGQLGTKTKENLGWVGQFEMPLELSLIRLTGSF